MEVSEIEPNVHLVSLDSRQVYLIGTAHVSEESAKLVTRTVRTIRPDSVLVELCPSRLQNMREPDRWKNTDIFEVIKEGKAYVLFAQLLLAGYQKKLAADLGIKPGAEMKAALDTAAELNIPVVPIDREVKTTLKRAWASASAWTLIRVLGSIFVPDEKSGVSKETIEDLKKRDMLEGLLGEFREELPGVANALIAERDRFMTSKIQQQQSKTCVAVIGAGHIPGILQSLGSQVDSSELESVPPPSAASKFVTWSIPGVFLLLVVLGMNSGISLSTLLTRWALATGSCAALGAILTFSHPLTILSGFLAAPFTTLHPLLAAGWVCGLVEAYLRRPRVIDLETITDDISTLKGIYSNRALRVLLVLIIVNLTTTIGVFVGFGSLGSHG